MNRRYRLRKLTNFNIHVDEKLFFRKNAAQYYSSEFHAKKSICTHYADVKIGMLKKSPSMHILHTVTIIIPIYIYIHICSDL